MSHSFRWLTLIFLFVCVHTLQYSHATVDGGGYNTASGMYVYLLCLLHVSFVYTVMAARSSRYCAATRLLVVDITIQRAASMLSACLVLSHLALPVHLIAACSPVTLMASPFFFLFAIATQPSAVDISI